MQTEIKMTCRVHDESGFKFLVTSHEEIDNSISIHGIALDAKIQCNTAQAQDLINKLQSAIIRIEASKLMKGESKT